MAVGPCLKGCVHCPLKRLLPEYIYTYIYTVQVNSLFEEGCQIYDVCKNELFKKSAKLSPLSGPQLRFFL